MRLTRRIIASRANGKRSRGPKTDQGKQRSSINAIRHGLLSKCVVMPEESHEIFDTLFGQYTANLQPANDVQRTHVEEMVTAIWKMRRLWAVETELWGKTAANRPETTAIGRITGAFSDLSRQPELHLLLRYEARFHHAYHRALQHFLAFEELSGGPPNLDPNNPNAIIDVKPNSPAEHKSDCQTNLDPNNSNIITGVEPDSSVPQ
jgi:hypothetical protein